LTANDLPAVFRISYDFCVFVEAVPSPTSRSFVFTPPTITSQNHYEHEAPPIVSAHNACNAVVGTRWMGSF